MITSDTPNRAAAILALAILGVLTLPCRTMAASDQFYVSKQGRDEWSGRLPKPTLLNRDGPFRTIHRAQAAVRRLREHDQVAGEITVLIREGRYVLTRPLVFGPEDSGRERGRTAYRSFPDETVSIVGSLTVAGWQTCYNGMFRADLTGTRIAEAGIEQLYFGGRPQPVARTPNRDPSHPYSGGFLYVTEPADPPQPSVLCFEPGRTNPARWRAPGNMRVLIWTGTPPRKETIPLAETGHQSGRIMLAAAPARTPKRGNRFFLEGAFEELDAEGEWYYDQDTFQLYFRPPDGRNPEEHVTVPVASHILQIGQPTDDDKTTSNIEFSRIAFAETTDSLATFSNAAKCDILDSLLMNCGKDAIAISSNSAGIRIARCDITRTGAAAIAVEGQQHDGNRLPSRRHVLTENVIVATGQNMPHIAAVRIGNAATGDESAGNAITHNLIRDLPGPAISIHGARSTCDYNHIHHVNLASSHLAAVHFGTTGETDAAGVVRFNWIHHTGGYSMPRAGKWEFPAGTWGIGVAASVRQLRILGNCINQCPEQCIRIQGTGQHHIEGNLLVGPAKSLIRLASHHKKPQTDNTENHGHTVQQNIFITMDAKTAWLAADNPETLIRKSDRNVLWAEDNPLTAILGKDSKPVGWDQWQNMQHDLRSVVADPLLRNPRKGDFHIAPRAMALKLGFVPIPFERIGVTDPDRRPAWNAIDPHIRETYLLHPGPGPIKRWR